MSNPLKLVAMRWTYASVHGYRLQIPWDTNLPQYGRYHYAFAKGTRNQIIAYTEGNCPHRNRWSIEAWMKGSNPEEIKVGIDCSGYVYRVLDEAATLSGALSLVRTLGTTCEYTALDTLTPMNRTIHRAIDVRAGDTMRFNNGRHAGAIIETVVDGAGRLQEIWYTHSSFTRGPHIGYITVGDPYAPINARSQNWYDEMWDGLSNNNLRDLYFTSVHQSPFYQGPRPRVTKLTGVRITIDGAPVHFSIPPFVLNGRTLCHVRALAEAIGAVVTWQNDSQKVTLTQGDRTAECQVGSEVGIINGRGSLLEEPPILIGQSVVVPARFVAEALGYEVEWDQAQLLVNLVRQ